VRVYSYANPVWKRHSYLVGNEQGGTTDVLGWLEIDNLTTTIADVRPMIEVHVVNKMNRRTPLFQETLEIMNNAHNFHRRPESDRRQYALGRSHGTVVPYCHQHVIVVAACAALLQVPVGYHPSRC